MFIFQNLDLTYKANSMGYMPSGSHLPISPISVVDTPEVTKAKAEFKAAFEVAKVMVMKAQEKVDLAETQAMIEQAEKVNPSEPVVLTKAVGLMQPSDKVQDIEVNPTIDIRSENANLFYSDSG